nr:hypothetical protein [Tanacetum cinerariifolium]
VIEFGDSYEVPTSTASTTTTDTPSGKTGNKSGRTVTLTAEDMQKKKNDVKARTTLLLSLPDEHQPRFTKHNSGNEDGNTVCVPTASASVATISQDTACAYIASQSSGSQIKFEDINQIDEDDMEEMDIKWNMALLSMRADKWVILQENAGLPEAKTEEGETTTDRDHALVADEIAPTEFALMANTSAESKVFDNYLCSNDCKKNNDSLNKTLKQEKEGVDGKPAGLLTASKDLNNLIKSQRADKNKKGLRYSVVPPPAAQIYSSPKKDLSWTGLLEFADDTVTDYSRPSPT